MADEQQYYNPIIQSMIAAQQGNLQRAKLQQEAEQFKADKVIREHQLGLQQTQIENEHQHQLNLSELAQKAHELTATAQKFANLKAANDLAASGTNLQTALPSVGLPQMQGIPDYQTQLKNEAQRVQTLSGAKTTGEMSAGEPFAIRQAERDLYGKQALMEQENQFKAGLTDKELASKERIAKLERGTQIAINNATNATHLQLGQMQYVPTPDTLRSMIVAGATGQAKLNFANPQERVALGQIQQLGGRDVDPKEAQALREGQQLIPLFDKLDKFADKLPSTRVGAFVAGKTLEGKNALGISSETQNELNQIMSQALVVGKNIEGLTGGRTLSKQLELDLNSITSGAITKDDAKKRLQNLKDLYVNKQENMLMGGLPDWQKDLVKKTYGIKDVPNPQGSDPDFLKVAPKTNSAGHTLDRDMSIKLGKPVYVGQ